MEIEMKWIKKKCKGYKNVYSNRYNWLFLMFSYYINIKFNYCVKFYSGLNEMVFKIEIVLFILYGI